MEGNRFTIYDNPETRQIIIHDTLGVVPDEYVDEALGFLLKEKIINNPYNNKHKDIIKDKVLDGWHDLRLSNYYFRLYREMLSRIEDKIWDFEEKYDPEDYFINESESSFGAGIIPVEGKDLTEWFKKFHIPFCQELDLKLVHVKKLEYIHNDYVKYTLGYTYKDNPYFNELNVDKINGVKA